MPKGAHGAAPVFRSHVSVLVFVRRLAGGRDWIHETSVRGDRHRRSGVAGVSVHSAGILLYRLDGRRPQVMLVHPGGPLWAARDAGAWSIPKGLVDDGEALLDAARREFCEETGFAVDGRFTALGELRQPSGKIVHAWAVEGDFDVERLHSNTFEMEWPKRSGRMQAFPEVDRAQWFDLGEARVRITRGQAGFLDRLMAQLKDTR